MQANYTCLCSDYIILDHHQKLQSDLSHLHDPVFVTLEGYTMIYTSHLDSTLLQAGRQGRTPESLIIGFASHLTHIRSPIQDTLSNAHNANRRKE